MAVNCYHHAAYGVADAETRTPVSAETLFQAASISKPVGRLIQLEYRWDVLDKPVPRTYGPG